MIDVKITPAVEADAAKISALILRAIRLTNASDYKSSEINAICENFTTEMVLSKMAQRDVFVARLDREIVGTVSLGDGKLHSMFVEPIHQNTGIGVKLAMYLEQHAMDVGLSTLRLSSSLTARSFYEKLGYQLLNFNNAPLAQHMR